MSQALDNPIVKNIKKSIVDWFQKNPQKEFCVVDMGNYENKDYLVTFHRNEIDQDLEKFLKEIANGLH